MKQLFFSSFLLFAFCAHAQKAYFQQEVDYTIDVRLDDQTHSLSGQVTIHYTNHSPEALDSIYFHLWPNAYKHRRTAFARQQILLHKADFYFADEQDLGYIDSLDFTVDGSPARWRLLHPDTPDIAVLYLPHRLATGGKLTIHTPFHVKIPKTFSRMGHIGQSYQITQWYPKPAVYDRKGWHPIPYLDQGEFYSEFGNFDVTIHLPADYIVGATGSLQTESEIRFLDSISLPTGKERPDRPRARRTGMKTLHYTAKKVHDFAWFADKDFLVWRDTLHLPSGKLVDVTTLARPDVAAAWKEVTGYTKRAIRKYSEWIGEYPYPQQTVVQSTIKAGGGMEYPMITVIDGGSGKHLDDVVTHETGHNWFYGILATNERAHAWMDEGMNTFYESRYMDEFYHDGLTLETLFYKYEAAIRADVPPETPPDKVGMYNYGLTAYFKPALALRDLEQYLGRDSFDRAMQAYYRQWQFKHPEPEDFFRVMREQTGRDVSSFFHSILHTNYTTDYAVRRLRSAGPELQLRIRHRGLLQSPFTIRAADSVLYRDAGFAGSKTITLPPLPDSLVAKIRLYSYLDINPLNNGLRPPRLAVKPGFGISTRRRYLLLLPLYAFNPYDKHLVGLGLHNITVLPAQKLQFSVLPMYGLGSKQLAGLAQINYPIYFQKGLFRKIEPLVDIRRFSFWRFDNHTLRYTRIAPELRFVFHEPADVPERQSELRLRHEIVSMDEARFDTTGYLGNRTVTNRFWQLIASRTQKMALVKRTVEATLEYGRYHNYDVDKDFLKAQIHARAALAWRPGKFFYIGTHLNYFLRNPADRSVSFNNGLVMGSLAAAGGGQDDYAFRHLYSGRNPDGFYSRHLYEGDGGLKFPLGNAPIGKSNAWMASVNLAMDAPFPSGRNAAIRPYLDAVWYGEPVFGGDLKTRFIYSAGIQFDLLHSIQINFPLLSSRELMQTAGKRVAITYQINLDNLIPQRMIDPEKFL